MTDLVRKFFANVLLAIQLLSAAFIVTVVMPPLAKIVNRWEEWRERP